MGNSSVAVVDASGTVTAQPVLGETWLRVEVRTDSRDIRYRRNRRSSNRDRTETAATAATVVTASRGETVDTADVGETAKKVVALAFSNSSFTICVV